MTTSFLRGADPPPSSFHLDQLLEQLLVFMGGLQWVDALELSPALNTWARFAFNVPYSALLVLVLRLQHGPAELSTREFGPS